MRTALLLSLLAPGLLACNDYDDGVTASDALDIGVRRDAPVTVDVAPDVPDIPMDVTGAVTVQTSNVTTTLDAADFSALGTGDLTVSQLPTLGRLELSGTPLAVDAVVPEADLDAGNVTYVRTDPSLASDVVLITRANVSIDVAINLSATSQSLPAARDATLYESDTGALASGVGNGLFVGKTGGGTLRRTVLAFDVAPAAPAGSLVVDAQLRLTVGKGGGGADVAFAAHRVTAEWTEGPSKADPSPGAMNGGGGGVASETGDVTWIHRTFDTVLWTTPGGDAEATASATFSAKIMTGIQQEFAVPGLVPDIQAWVDGAQPNHGWLLKLADEGGSGVRRFGSREGDDGPRLVVHALMP